MKVEYLVIHHSLTKDGNVNDWEAIRKYHINTNKWLDIGYHFGIEKINDKYIIQKGRSEKTVGAHTKEQGMNKKSLGICVVGNFDLYEPDEKTFNLLIALCTQLCLKYKLSSDKIRPHNEYAPKSCPGKMFNMDKLRKEVAKNLGEI
jgi:N-acetylmuramoyl-L-alanine amidase